MAVPFIRTSFAAGEISPSLLGHVDLQRVNIGAMTMRSMFVSYRGGAYSRAGTAFVGYSKQTGRTYPPRLISFQFSINQGLALEFGDGYMRVIQDGAFVTETAFGITAATNAKPCVITVGGATEVSAATPINTGTTVSYAPGDTVTLAGGTYSSPAILAVTNTTLDSVSLNAPGGASDTTSYAPADTIDLAGGTQSTNAAVTVGTTQVVAAGIAHAGTGGTTGTQTVAGTTGTGTKFQASVTVSGGGITAVLSITVAGDYTVNPSNLTDEPVTGASLTGAALTLTMGILSMSLTTHGVFTTNAPGGAFTQASTSGSGTGATFNQGLFGVHAVTVSQGGVYSVDPGNPVAQLSSSGSGQGVTFDVTSWSSIAPGWSAGDWVAIADVGGMTQLNGQTYVLGAPSGSSYPLLDVFGNEIDATGFGVYTSGGTAARIYTLATIYGEADLEYLKFTQSADVMSLTCWNQLTGTSYPPQDLERFLNNDWAIAPPNFAETVSPPASATGTPTSSPGAWDMQYVVTSVSPVDGSESVASPIADVPDTNNPAVTGDSTIVVNWSKVNGVQQYNVYKASPSVAGEIPTGALFGYAGTAYGTEFTDSNITPDFDQVPPLHVNPFAPGQVPSVDVTASGSGFSSAPSYSIGTSTGSGLVLQLIIVSSELVGIIVVDPGENYQPGDTITISGGGGTGATAVLNIGPQTGTYPSAVSYFQERRVYAGTPNNPDTYFMSQPGAFTNFDARIPTIDSDSITGSPWSVQVNGIQFLIPMPGGLVVLTGKQAWQLTGAGGSSLNPQAITPSNQQAQPQAYNGCSQTVPPIQVNNEILYVQAKGSIVRVLAYNFFVNIYTGTDITETSSHLFTGYTVREWAWCEEPYKVAWAVRNDGVLLSLTYLKEQEVSGWGRSDTQGLFQSVCSVTEPPVDALYCAVQRYTPAANIAGVNCYTIERMDNRIWAAAENCWCVDCGLSYPQPEPAATLIASSATGLGSITGATGIVGGANYNPATTTGTVIDDNGQGSGTGAVPTLTFTSGVLTSVTFAGGSQGSGYVQPKLVIVDASGAGSGSGATPILNNTMTFTATAAVFSVGNVGSVVRTGGGIAEITAYTDNEHVTANMLSPIVQCVPNTSPLLPVPQPAGNWTMTAPVTEVSGLTFLAGMSVTGLADGNVIPPQIVSAEGGITLATAASAIIVGLAYLPQFQSVYLDVGQPTVQGQRKRIPAATCRLETSRGVVMAQNEPDGSLLSPMQISPTWANLAPVPDTSPYDALAAKKPYNALCAPLYTGDRRVPLVGGFNKPGQVALQQNNPLPLNVLALVPEIDPGDSSQPPGPARAPSPRE